MFDDSFSGFLLGMAFILGFVVFVVTPVLAFPIVMFGWLAYLFAGTGTGASVGAIIGTVVAPFWMIWLFEYRPKTLAEIASRQGS